jgi:DNA invertase Pin-like site-specific DNA recombinase
MIAAIYARKSTEQNTSDEEKSVTRQVEHARGYAAREGWTVPQEHVYVDDGVSGAEFESARASWPCSLRSSRGPHSTCW